MSKVALILHGQDSDWGRTGALLQQKGLNPYIVKASEGMPLPDLDDPELVATVVYGGPMSANDEHLDFIRDELVWLEQAMKKDHPVFGICLGSQLLARTLGAAVSTHPDGVTEVGFVDINPVEEVTGPFASAMPVFHWHQEGFDLPAGTKRLMTGQDFPNQAFEISKRHIGVQFHPEITGKIMRQWHVLGAECLDTWKGAQSADTHNADMDRHDGFLQNWMDGFLDHWLTNSDVIRSKDQVLSDAS